MGGRSQSTTVRDALRRGSSKNTTYEATDVAPRPKRVLVKGRPKDLDAGKAATPIANINRRSLEYGSGNQACNLYCLAQLFTVQEDSQHPYPCQPYHRAQSGSLRSRSDRAHLPPTTASYHQMNFPDSRRPLKRFCLIESIGCFSLLVLAVRRVFFKMGRMLLDNAGCKCPRSRRRILTGRDLETNPALAGRQAKLMQEHSQFRAYSVRDNNQDIKWRTRCHRLGMIEGFCHEADRMKIGTARLHGSIVDTL